MAKSSESSSEAVIDRGACHCGALRRASRRVSQLYDEALAPYGIKITQRGILSQIGRGDGPTVSSLADALIMDASTLGRNLRPLEQNGWIQLLIDPNDRRSRHVVLTPAGRAKLEESQAAWRDTQARFERAYGAEETPALTRSLDGIISEAFFDTFHHPM